jgi:aminotransferase
MIASLLAIVDPGEEVIVFEPFYENYGPDTILCGATPKYITLHEPDWHFDEKALVKAFSNKTKAIVLNTPNNPTGKVFSREELQFIADLCQKWGVVPVTDEIYEHILYEAKQSASPPFQGCGSRPSPSTPSPRPTASPAGGWGIFLPRLT